MDAVEAVYQQEQAGGCGLTFFEVFGDFLSVYRVFITRT